MSSTREAKRGWLRRSRSTRDWIPYSLRPAALLSVIAISASLVVFLQVLLLRSQRDNGIFFAPDINKVSFWTTFPYLQLPTVVAVVYGFLWMWIDLDVRRMEPFFQLAKPGGATGEQSMLLCYPVDFIASVPLKALRFRHWAPFIASIATVLVFWGVTPSQAGIFAVVDTNRTLPITTAHSTAYLSATDGGTILSAATAQSVSNILWLNETLPPYMTRQEIFAPFSYLNNSTSGTTNITGITTRYSANVMCEAATPWTKNGQQYLNSTWGCSFLTPSLRPITDVEPQDDKIFDGLYVGYWNLEGNARYSLYNGVCPLNASNTFLAQWSKLNIAPSKLSNISSTQWNQYASITALWCRSDYYQQQVEATVTLPNQTISTWRPLGAAEALPADLFNETLFENAMNVGAANMGTNIPPPDGFGFRTEFPTLDWPDQVSYLKDTPLNTAGLTTMVPFAIGATQLNLENYMEPETLAGAYESAYQILFARQMAEVLSRTLDNSTAKEGLMRYTSQAIALNPIFTYIVEALLALVTSAAACLLWYMHQRRTHLCSDPSSIAALMALAVDDKHLLSTFSQHDRATTKELRDIFGKTSFATEPSERTGDGSRLRILEGPLNLSPASTNSSLSRSTAASGSAIAGVLPVELSLKIGSLFLLFQLTLSTALLVLFVLIERNDGVPLPSQNQFTRQLVENYILIAVGTLIEPFWVVLNRNLCSLQPFEALRRGQKQAKASIELNYDSLPPQLAIGKALCNKDYLLAIVCVMTLLANVLSVSFSGLLHENVVDIAQPSTFKQALSTRFQTMNGTAAPLIGASGGTMESFFIVESNRSANTPLPNWTDSEHFYLPVVGTESSAFNRRVNTSLVGATLACDPLSNDSIFELHGPTFSSSNFSDVEGSARLVVELTLDERSIACVPRNISQADRSGAGYLLGRPTGPSAFEFSYALQSLEQSSPEDNDFCMEHIAVGWVRADLVAGTKRRSDDPSFPIDYQNARSTIAVCRSQINIGEATALFSFDGHVLSSAMLTMRPASASDFSSAPVDVIGQAHQFIISRGDRWHNDSWASDWPNYLMSKTIGSSQLLDPQQPAPSFEDAVTPFREMYAELFAVWMGRNRDQLFETMPTTTITGYELVPTTRIFMSRTMMLIAEAILLSYVIVTMTLYIRRPWKILCRLPSDLASIIPYFAAGRAVEDMKATSHLTRRQRLSHLGSIDHRYGFGSFIGEDGMDHLGIESHPYVATLVKHDAWSSSLDSSKGSSSHRWLRQVYRWRSGKVMEGGPI